ncbi:RNA 2',3'-cyclic phosphodiesterase [Pseudomonadota bacterium]
MESFRGFIAVELPVTEEILSIGNDISHSDAQVKLVQPENIHITLKFLGQTPTQQIENIETIMKQSITDIQPHTINLIGTGVFPNERYIKVIWIGIKQGEQLATIASSLNNQLSALGFKKEKRSFSPHLTIGRMKTAKGKEHILSIIEKYKETIFAEVNVQEIILKKSTLTPKGPIYETITSVSL